MRIYTAALLGTLFAGFSHSSLADETAAALTLQTVSKSAVMLVKDSTGKVVGPYVSSPNPFIGNNAPEDNVFVRAGTRAFALHLDTSALGQPDKTVVYFASSTCTGTAYLTYSYQYEIGMPALPFAAVVGTTAYVGGTTHAGGTASSKRYLSGTQVICEQAVGGVFSGNYVPVVATFNMASLKLTPPFSVQ